MKIGVIGSGAVGMLFAFYLQKAGAAVTIYTRELNQAEHIRDVGITCMLGGQVHVQFPAAVPLQKAVLDDDYVFVAVKQYDLQSLLPFLQRTQARLIFLQNGMAHIPLLQYMQTQSIAVGIVEHGAKKEGVGVVAHTGVGITKLGIVTAHEDFQALLPLFQDPLFSLVQEENWQRVLINKLIINACINPLTALYRVQNGVLLENKAFYEAMRQVFEEVIVVLGEHPGAWERVCEVCQKTAHNQSSMLTDIKLGRKTEVDAIVGYLLAEAEKQNKHVPLLSFLYQSIKGMEP